MQRWARSAQARRRRAGGTSSSRQPPRIGRPEQREVRIERERPTCPNACCAGITEAVLDVRAMEELDGVLRAETKGTLRPGQSRSAASVAGESPREDVVAQDAGALPVAEPREPKRVM